MVRMVMSGVSFNHQQLLWNMHNEIENKYAIPEENLLGLSHAQQFTRFISNICFEATRVVRQAGVCFVLFSPWGSGAGPGIDEVKK
jgi:hypothetical protein